MDSPEAAVGRISTGASVGAAGGGACVGSGEEQAASKMAVTSNVRTSKRVVFLFFIWFSFPESARVYFTPDDRRAFDPFLGLSAAYHTPEVTICHRFVRDF
jgi:F0F1-type ATP synthase membrane subunit c/vacuolar-type H+-ATPase subunit K